MPVPRIFKRFASKSTLRVAQDTGSAPNVPADHEKDVSSRNLVTAAAIPTFSDNLEEAWAAANKELPKAKGVEKLLNRVGAPILGCFMSVFVLK